MPPVASPHKPPTRRDAIRVGLGVAAFTALSGCGLRLEHDAPAVPFVPRATHPGLALVRSDLDRCTAARACTAARLAAGGDPAPTTRLLRAMLSGQDAQIAALRTRLDQVDDGSAAGSPGSTRPTATNGSRIDTRAFAASFTAGVDAKGRSALAGAPADDLVLLTGVHAARSAAATLLGLPTASAPARPNVPEKSVAADLLDPVGAALYGLEVAAARVAPARAALVRSTVADLRRTREVLAHSAGSAARAPRLGYPLPFPVREPASADRLCAHVLSGLGAHLVACTPRLAGSADGLGTVVAWAQAAETARCRWGAPWRGLPLRDET